MQGVVAGSISVVSLNMLVLLLQCTLQISSSILQAIHGIPVSKITKNYLLKLLDINIFIWSLKMIKTYLSIPDTPYIELKCLEIIPQIALKKYVKKLVTYF